MYLPELPPADQPIDPTGFLGLRLRIDYRSHNVQPAPKALGKPDEAHAVNLLYWGGDIVGQEAESQRTRWAAWPNQAFVPASAAEAEPKRALLEALRTPAPAPASVLYLFCRFSSGDGEPSVLQFGAGFGADDIIGEREMRLPALPDRPFIFANACATATSDAYNINELEEGFFLRQCRAYLGTEAMVPIQLASRFATTFFRFFYRLVTPQPIAAGEAVAQARLFLWRNYRNIGGLFYLYVHQYEVFMADDTEVRAMR
jgi:hypothetical protein